jgi:outer membrane lipoprotein-sorting protein
MIKHLLLISCIAVIFLSGCGTKRVATSDVFMKSPEQMKQEQELKARVAQIPVNVDTLRAHSIFNTISTLRSEVKATVIKNGNKVGTFKGAFVFRAPDSLRLQLYDPFGGTVADLVRVVGMMNIYVPKHNTIYTGWAPQFSVPKEAIYSAEVGGPRHILYVFKPGGTELELVAKYSYDPETLSNTSITAFHNSRRSMSMYFGPLLNKAPEHMKFTFDGGLLIEMTLQEPEVNMELKDSLFHPFDKEGKKVRPLSELISMGESKG